MTATEATIQLYTVIFPGEGVEEGLSLRQAGEAILGHDSQRWHVEIDPDHDPEQGGETPADGEALWTLWTKGLNDRRASKTVVSVWAKTEAEASIKAAEAVPFHPAWEEFSVMTDEDYQASFTEEG